jgi:hypothetical protein
MEASLRKLRCVKEFDTEASEELECLLSSANRRTDTLAEIRTAILTFRLRPSGGPYMHVSFSREGTATSFVTVSLVPAPAQATVFKLVSFAGAKCKCE